MKKRILTMLLALAMILSIVPMMAMAAGCEAGHDFGDTGYCSRCSTPDCAHGYHSNYPNMDDSRCDYCNLYICAWGGHDYDENTGYCQYCSTMNPNFVVPQPCTHANQRNVAVVGGHQMICPDCNTTLGDVVAHDFDEVTGFCKGCSLKNDCIHNWWTKDLGDGTCRMVCTLCGEAHADAAKEHKYENGVCIYCSREQKCEHTWWTFDLGNGTHQQKCSKCGEPHPEYGQVENHEFENGVCIDCSAEQGGNVRPPYHRPNDGKHDNVPGTGDILAMIVAFVQNLF